MTKTRRKGSRSGFDYATYSENRGFHRGAAAAPHYAASAAPHYGAYTMTPYYPPTTPYHPIYNGYLNSGYGTWYTNAYGADGFQYMRGYDPSYDAFYTEGPSVDDKWRSTYPYAPTSYLHRDNQDQSNIGVAGGARSRNSRAGDTSAGDTETEDGEGREHWGSKWEFYFSCVGLSVGIGNVWRFPYLAYENGGGAFLIPYVILLFLIGKPMYFMELALGQFSQLGPLEVWKNMVPVGRGIGFAMCTISLIVAIYYNVVMGYSLFYMFASMQSTLPWTNCDFEGANKTTCYVTQEQKNSLAICTSSPKACQHSSEQYWERFVLGIHNAPIINRAWDNGTSYKEVFRDFQIGEIKWDLSLCLLLSWIIVFFCLFKGIKSSGKVVYFTATFPYLLLLALLGVAVSLDGAIEGIKFLFIPKWEKLMEINVWRKAAEQMFFSLSVSWGGLIMFGSYNKFKHKVHYPAFIISFLDLCTSIIASIVIFSVLGNLKVKGNYSDISQVVQEKQGLAFVAYPEAVSHLPFLPQLWSVMFFFMLFLLGLDSEFALLETVFTGIYDMFPKTRAYKPYVCLVVCCVCYLLSIPCVSHSGNYIFDLMDTYAGGIGVLWIAIFETIAIMWIYGIGRFASDLKFMLDINVNIVIKICWFITPIVLAVIFGYSCLTWEAPVPSDGFQYPDWAQYIGWGMVFIVVVQIPVIALIMIIYYATQKKLKEVTQPTGDWGPGDKIARQDWITYQYNKSILESQCKQHPYGYDNHAMNYSMPYYNTVMPSASYPMHM